MVTEEEIRRALHASRVVPTNVANPHGPLGLEQLAAEVAQRTAQSQPSETLVRRAIDLPVDTWEKLDKLAATSSQSSATPIRPSDIAATIIEQFLTSTNR